VAHIWLDTPGTSQYAAAVQHQAGRQSPQYISANESNDEEDEPDEELLQVTNSEYERKLIASEPLASDSARLPMLLISVMHKMNMSPINPVVEIDKHRSYIFMNREQWMWKKITWKKAVLNRHKLPLPSASQFVLLKDLSGGLDGRVWMACTTSGLVCVFKFANIFPLDTPSHQQSRLEHEIEFHKKMGVEWIWQAGRR